MLCYDLLCTVVLCSCVDVNVDVMCCELCSCVAVRVMCVCCVYVLHADRPRLTHKIVASPFAPTSAYVCLFMCACLCVCLHVYVYVCLLFMCECDVCMCVCLCLCRCMCVMFNVCVCACVCVCVCVCACAAVLHVPGSIQLSVKLDRCADRQVSMLLASGKSRSRTTA